MKIILTEKQLDDIKKSVKENIDTNKTLQEITSDEVDLSSFKEKKSLNDKFWFEDKLKSNVRRRLLKVADDFVDFLNIEKIGYEDVLFVGSLANYNWSKYSDVDLHIVIDFKKVNKDMKLVKEYFDAKKRNWNNEHDNLKIYNFPVELYVQDKKEKLESGGIYSIEKNKWVKKPAKENAKLNKEKIRDKSANIINKIDDLYKRYKKKDITSSEMKEISNKVKIIFDKIKKIRKSGLDSSDGEHSVGNIVFKVLRRSGYIEKLVEIKRETYDKINTIK